MKLNEKISTLLEQYHKDYPGESIGFIYDLEPKEIYQVLKEANGRKITMVYQDDLIDGGEIQYI
jgi:hypothetical protein